MRTSLKSCLVALCALATAAAPAGDAPRHPGFARFAALVGDWVSAADNALVKKGTLVARYHLSGGGTAVVEEVFPDTPHAMTTVYHLDGKDLVLTHYCTSGNQPRMRARASEGTRIAFAFDGGTNIDGSTTSHMHEATFDFIGPDEIQSAWVEYENGKPAMTVGMHLLRKTR
jgi:hypothetical protein